MVDRVASASRRILLGSMTHEEWQSSVLGIAHQYRWEAMHVEKAQRRGKWTTPTSQPGWPDLTLWHEGAQRLVFAELKVEGDYPSPVQRKILASLATAGCEVHVWRPSQLDAVVTCLSNEEA